MGGGIQKMFESPASNPILCMLQPSFNRFEIQVNQKQNVPAVSRKGIT